MRPIVIRTGSFADTSADTIASLINTIVKRKGECRLGLSGGSTPKIVYKALTQKDIPWQNVVITYSDERMVPPTDPESNFKMTVDTLLQHVGILESNVNRMEGELAPEEAAVSYESRLKALATLAGTEVYEHDILLLGIGLDGHTASLFPGTDALLEEKAWVASVVKPEDQSKRLSLTFPVINASHHIIFLVNDTKKNSVVEECIARNSDYPAGRVYAQESLTWIVGS